MSDESAAPEEGVTPEAEAAEAPVAEAEAPATDEAPAADEAPAEEPAAEAAPEEESPAEEPQAEAVEEAEEAPAEEPVAEAEPVAGTRVARVFFCDRGHRTTSLWSEPTTCKARPVRSGPECGRQLYPVGELPETVVKALNPLKASKKAAKKG